MTNPKANKPFAKSLEGKEYLWEKWKEIIATAKNSDPYYSWNLFLGIIEVCKGEEKQATRKSEQERFEKILDLYPQTYAIIKSIRQRLLESLSSAELIDKNESEAKK